MPFGALDLPAGGQGVLPAHRLTEAIDAGVIDAGPFTIPASNIQPASLDLRLGEVAYRIRCSFLPDADTVERKVKDYVIDEISLHNGVSSSRIDRCGPAARNANRPSPQARRGSVSLLPAMRQLLRR